MTIFEHIKVWWIMRPVSPKERAAYLRGIHIGWWLHEHRDVLNRYDLRRVYGIGTED